jgi:serine/threonine protein kinase
VKWLSDAALTHLTQVADRPDLSGTRYELVEPVGRGGMGTVYRARDRELDRPVALKVLNAAPEDAAAVARMTKEARIIARLEHPSIVPVHDCGLLPDGRFYYAMKLVRGKRLDESVSPATALTERLQLFQKVCDAVSFAHAHGVIHRDLKPQNIMIGAFGEVLVMDWGIAQEAGESAAPGTVVGTPGYMAPEQERGETGRIDARADVYALGAILYFLFTGQPPEPPLRRPQQYDRLIPRPLEAVCLKALAPERDDRYPGAAELAGDVADFLAGRRVRAYPEGPLDTAVRLATNYRTAIVLVLTYLLVRVALFFYRPGS